MRFPKINKNLYIILLGLTLLTLPTVFGLELYPVYNNPLDFPNNPSGAFWSVTVVDRDSGVGIVDARVWVRHTYQLEPLRSEVFMVLTNSNGYASGFLDVPVYDTDLMVDKDGYTSDLSDYGYSWYGAGRGLDYVDVVELYPGEPTVREPTSGDLTIKVVYEGSVVEGANVAIYENHDNVEYDYAITDSNGVVVFNSLSGFFQVTVNAEGYLTEYGAVGVGNDITYVIELHKASGGFGWILQLSGLMIAGFGGIGYWREKRK